MCVMIASRSSQSQVHISRTDKIVFASFMMQQPNKQGGSTTTASHTSSAKPHRRLFLLPKAKIVEKHAQWYHGGIAAACATCFTHPIDLIKVLVQTHDTKTEGKFRIIPATRALVKRDGFLILFNGLSASVLRQLTYSTTRFAVYDVLKTRYAGGGPVEQIPYLKKVELSSIAGVTGGLIGAPADLVNVRMQNDAKLPAEQRRNYKNGIHGLYRIICDEGVRQLFAGGSWVMIRSIIMTVGQLSFYDQIKESLIKLPGIRIPFPVSKDHAYPEPTPGKKVFKRRVDGLYHFHDDIATHFIASFGAALLTTSISQPVDVLKTRVQNSSKQFGMAEIVRLVNADDGVRGFFKGFWPRFLRLGPNTVLLFVFYEQLRHKFGTPVVVTPVPAEEKDNPPYPDVTNVKPVIEDVREIYFDGPKRGSTETLPAGAKIYGALNRAVGTKSKDEQVVTGK